MEINSRKNEYVPSSADALPKFLAELVSLRKKSPPKRLLMATTDVNDALSCIYAHPVFNVSSHDKRARRDRRKHSS